MNAMVSTRWSRRAMIGAIPIVGSAAFLSVRAKTPQSLAESLALTGASGDEVKLPNRGGTLWRKAGQQKLDPDGEGLWWFRSTEGDRWVLAENPVRPEHLGATGRGAEHGILQQWARLLGNGIDGRMDGFHHVDAQLRFARQHHFKIDGQGGLILTADAPVRFGFSAMMFSDCSDFELSGLTLDSNRAGRRPESKPAHTLQFLSCHRFRVSEVQCRNAVTDGFYLASSTPEDRDSHCSNFVFERCRAINGFRQGMSIIQGHAGVLRECEFLATNGFPPQAGVDLESNRGNPRASISNILFDRCRFQGNKGYGLQVSSKSLPDDITVKSCIFEDNADGAILWGATSGQIIATLFRSVGKIDAAVQKTGNPKQSKFRLIDPKIS